MVFILVIRSLFSASLLLTTLPYLHITSSFPHSDVLRRAIQTDFKISTHSSSSTIYITQNPLLSFSHFSSSYYLSLISSQLQGILFIAHDCSQSAYDFWPYSDQNCQLCRGLAEEVKIVKSALSQQFLVIAISSLDRNSGCWGLDDLPVVIDILSQIQRSTRSSTNLPIFGLGSSSGGRFLWKLFQNLQILQLSSSHPPPFQFDGLIFQSISIPLHSNSLFPFQHPPPIIFNPMAKDQLMFDAILRNHHSLIADHDFPPSLVQVQICHPVPFVSSFLLSRLQHINLTRTEATQIASLMTIHGFTNQTGHLIVDPTEPLNNWRLVLSSTLPSETLQKVIPSVGESPLAKIFSRCWAYHEYCADHIEEDLLWMKRMIA
jgi:hypothetical protein